MKKFNILMFGALAVLAASCEKDLEPAKPQVNPQEPIVTVGDVTSVTAGVLAGETHSLNLNDYATEAAQILVMAQPETKDLPDGSSISYKIELSKTDDFANSIILDAPHGETAATQDNSYVSGDKWIAAHVSLFGSNPKERQVYYRVPTYVVIDGSDYRYGGFDNYAATGMITESYNPGFFTEQAYYFLSDVTTMDLANATEVENFKFHHNPDVDAYDDPVFTYTFKITPEAIAANGGCKWRIAPQSTVGTSNWAKTVGPKYDGDTELQGELVSENAGSGLITKSGRYELSINMREMTYTLTELPNVIYMVGAPQGWNINNNAVYLPETYDGSNIYSGLVKVDEGQGIFRFYSQLGNWDKASIGAADGDSTIDISLDANGVYTGSLFETGVNANNAKVNWQLPNWAGGALEITLNLNAMTIEIKKASVNTGIFLRGGMNSWGSDPAYEFKLTNETGVYVIDDVTISANTEFKVADASWGSINFGAGEDNVIVPDTPYELVSNSQTNISLKVDFKGKATLTKTGVTYSLMLLVPKAE